jgi:citrate lyase subunit beta/citryl-CoA lyase
MIDNAKGLPADEIFLDVEDAVAPDAKADARTLVAAALAESGWAGQLRGVRVNDWTTPWTHADVIEVLSAVGSTPGAQLDIVVLPKVSDVSHVQALDLLLTQLETVQGLPVGGIGVDAQIEDARGLTNIDAIAAAPRVQALVLGPADLTASLKMRTRVAGRSAALGYDGKWVLHPGQIAAGNEIFSPRQEEYDHAELVLEAYEWHTSSAGGVRGAVMLGDEMIDEASRKMALVVVGKGRAAGMQRQSQPFVPPSAYSPDAHPSAMSGPTIWKPRRRTPSRLSPRSPAQRRRPRYRRWLCRGPFGWSA